MAGPVSPDPRLAELKSICLFLGPYRNLTTLTAGVLSLHPSCRVLNHGKQQVFPRTEDNFLLHYSDENLRRFLARALELSEGGSRGDAGGSITHSHAFDHPVMRDAYRRRFGAAPRTDPVHAFVWKESLRTSNTIRKHDVDLGALFARNHALRFLLPIRNPLDTARSNLKTGHRDLFRNLKHHGLEGVLDAVVEEIAWVFDQRARFPDRFFTYYQDEAGRDMLERLEAFLGLPSDPNWLDDADACLELKPSYRHDAEAHRTLRRSVEEHLQRHPAVAEHVLNMTAAT